MAVTVNHVLHTFAGIVHLHVFPLVIYTLDVVGAVDVWALKLFRLQKTSYVAGPLDIASSSDGLAVSLNTTLFTVMLRLLSRTEG